MAGEWLPLELRSAPGQKVADLSQGQPVAATPQGHHLTPRGRLSLGDKHVCCLWLKGDCRSLWSQLSHGALGERNRLPHPQLCWMELQAKQAGRMQGAHQPRSRPPECSRSGPGSQQHGVGSQPLPWSWPRPQQAGGRAAAQAPVAR